MFDHLHAETPSFRRIRRLRRAAITVASLSTAAALVASAPAVAANAPGAHRQATLRRSSVSATASTPTSGPIAAANWLARQFNAKGYIPSQEGGPGPDYSDTAQAVIGLEAAGTHAALVRRAVVFLEDHVVADSVVSVGGKKVGDPGSLAFLILDAHGDRVNPMHFGRYDLIRRLRATIRTSGHNRGLFGASAPTYDGAYRQGLSLIAMAAAGNIDTPALRPAIAWSQRQQCSSGGWEAYRANLAKACTPRDPSTFTGPDTNSTSLAVEGLVAQHATFQGNVIDFLGRAQDADGGWGYYGGPSDGDSTSIVLQALIAMHASRDARFSKKARTPRQWLTHDQIHSGAQVGGVAYQAGPKGVLTANLLTTEQAAPAMANLALPFGPRPSA